MKKLMLLTILLFSALQANAHIECRVLRDEAFTMNDVTSQTLIRKFPEANGRYAIYSDHVSTVQFERADETLRIVILDSKTGLPLTGISSKTEAYLSIYDGWNKQHVTCEKVNPNSNLRPRYIRAAVEGGSEGPKAPDYKGCWIISCAY